MNIKSKLSHSLLLASVIILLWVNGNGQDLIWPALSTAGAITGSQGDGGLIPITEDERFLTQLSYNPSQAKYFRLIDQTFELTPAERAMLKKNGFVVSERLAFVDFSTAYAYIYWKDLPVLVTTDSILHAIHHSYDELLATMEYTILTDRLVDLLTETRRQLQADAKANTDPDLAQLYADLDVYLTVPLILLTNPADVNSYDADVVHQYLMLAEAASQVAPVQLFGGERKVDFSLFEPRGHYTRSRSLERYFRAMSWLAHIDFRLVEYTPQGEPILNTDHVAAAVLFHTGIEQAGQRPNWRDFDTIFRLFVGESDNTTLPDLDRFLLDASLESPEEVYLYPDPEKLLGMLVNGDYGRQHIAGQILEVDPNNPDSLPRPVSFALLGPRFTMDSLVMSDLTFDRLVVDNQKVLRPLPSPLDVMYALGNDRARTHLGNDLARYGYRENLDELRDLLDSRPDDFWQSSVYNRWLGLLRALNADTTSNAYPQSMRTAAWADKTLNTQLGSWAQLRHDNILYAKQSVSSGLQCEYPAGYVEPYPEFYAAVVDYAETGRAIFNRFNTDARPDRERYIYITALEYFENLEYVARQLQKMAEKELAGQPFSVEEEIFLKSISIRKIEPYDTICAGIEMRENWDGWYMDLLIGQESNPALIADIHTNPQEDPSSPLAPASVLHVGTGTVAANLFIADTGDGLTMYVGPAFTYYEVVEEGYPPVRLTDDDWNERLNSSPRPAPPAWAASFRLSELQALDYLLLPEVTGR